MPIIEVGTKVRAKTRTMCGWKGVGIATNRAIFKTDHVLVEGIDGIKRGFLRYELAILRDQSS